VEVKWLSGQPIELLDYMAAVNCQRRVLETIGVERVPRLVGPGFGELLQADRREAAE